VKAARDLRRKVQKLASFRSTPVSFSMLSLSLLLTHCTSEGKGQRGTRDPQMVPASGVDPAPSAGRSAERRGTELSDQQIAMASDAFHTAALDQAKVVYPKTKDAAVKRFAQTLLADHARAKQDETDAYVELRLSPMESPLSTEIGVESGKVLFALRDASSPDEVDKLFVAAQLAAHQKFLDALDTELLPNAHEPRLRGMLETFRPRVELHLEMARGLKQALDNP
jgi:putative membrane protein